MYDYTLTEIQSHVVKCHFLYMKNCNILLTIMYIFLCPCS